MDNNYDNILNDIKNDLKNICNFANIEIPDDILDVILKKTISYILNYCNITIEDFKNKIENFYDVVLGIAVYKINLLGREGISMEKFADVSVNFTEDIPVIYKNQLQKYRKIVY